MNERTDTGKPSTPKIDQIVAIARALSVSVDFLLTGEEFWSELQDEPVRDLLDALRGLPLDPRLARLGQEFLSLDDEDRELVFQILKLCSERKQRRSSNGAATASGAG